MFGYYDCYLQCVRGNGTLFPCFCAVCIHPDADARWSKAELNINGSFSGILSYHTAFSLTYANWTGMLPCSNICVAALWKGTKHTLRLHHSNIVILPRCCYICFRLQFRNPNRIVGVYGVGVAQHTTTKLYSYIMLLLAIVVCRIVHISLAYCTIGILGIRFCRYRRRCRCQQRRNWFCIANVLNGIVGVVVFFEFQCTSTASPLSLFYCCFYLHHSPISLFAPRPFYLFLYLSLSLSLSICVSHRMCSYFLFNFSAKWRYREPVRAKPAVLRELAWCWMENGCRRTTSQSMSVRPSI